MKISFLTFCKASKNPAIDDIALVTPSVDHSDFSKEKIANVRSG